MGMKVKATRLCYYGEARRRVGQVFELEKESDFSPTYMKSLDPKFKYKGKYKVPKLRSDEVVAEKKAAMKSRKQSQKVVEEEDEDEFVEPSHDSSEVEVEAEVETPI